MSAQEMEPFPVEQGEVTQLGRIGNVDPHRQEEFLVTALTMEEARAAMAAITSILEGRYSHQPAEGKIFERYPEDDNTVFSVLHRPFEKVWTRQRFLQATSLIEVPDGTIYGEFHYYHCSAQARSRGGTGHPLKEREHRLFKTLAQKK